MRAYMFALALGVALIGSSVYAHGPQIQITIDNDRITTRKLILEDPYSAAHTAPQKVYVMPLKEFSGVWYSRPNDTPSPTIPGQPSYFSGPGFAYGFDLADGGPQEFETDSVLSLRFTDGLKLWNGASFDDAGDTQLKAFSGSLIDTTSNFAITTDGGPSSSITVSTVAGGYGSGGANVHATIRYGLLGDGSASSSDSPDGVYLASLRLSSTQDGLADSEEFLFVLSKNVPYATVSEAVGSLGFVPSDVQWLVPELGALRLLLLGAMGMAFARHGIRQRKRD